MLNSISRISVSHVHFPKTVATFHLSPLDFLVLSFLHAVPYAQFRFYMQQPGLRSSNLLWNNWSWLRLPQKTQKQTEMPPRLLEKKNTSSVAINTDGHVRSSPAAEVNNEHIMWTRHVTFGTNINRWVDCWRDIPTTRLHSGGGELNSLLSTSTFISFSNYVDSSHVAAVCRSDFQQLSKATQDFIDLFFFPRLGLEKNSWVLL